MLNAVFNCPKCGKPVGDIPPRGRLVAICPTCRIKYEVLYGHVADGTVQEIVVSQSVRNYPPTVAQRYDLRLEFPTGRQEQIGFQLPDNEPRIPIRPGDLLYLIYLLRGDVRDTLLTVDNATTGQATSLALPRDVGAKKAQFISGIAGVSVALFLAGAGVGGGLIPFAIGVGTYFGLNAVLANFFTPTAEVNPDELRELDASQRLLWEKLRLQSARSQAIRASDEKREIRERLSGLRARMIGVGAQMYEKRIATIDRAISLTDAQIEVEQKLALGYERSIQMIEIELEAGATASVLDSDVSSHITAALDEMRALEEQQADLARQVAANDEVDALLSGNPVRDIPDRVG